MAASPSNFFFSAWYYALPKVTPTQQKHIRGMICCSAVCNAGKKVWNTIKGYLLYWGVSEWLGLEWIHLFALKRELQMLTLGKYHPLKAIQPRMLVRVCLYWDVVQKIFQTCYPDEIIVCSCRRSVRFRCKCASAKQQESNLMECFIFHFKEVSSGHWCCLVNTCVPAVLKCMK